MKKTGNTILITGGSTGIGLSLAVRFLEAGNRVLICGRRQDRLEEAEKAHPGLRTYVCDGFQAGRPGGAFRLCRPGIPRGQRAFQ